MIKFKKILTGYVNESKFKKGEYYLDVKNVGDQDVILKPGEKIALNKTPQNIKVKYPNVPDFSKNEKIEVSEESFSHLANVPTGPTGKDESFDEDLMEREADDSFREADNLEKMEQDFPF